MPNNIHEQFSTDKLGNAARSSRQEPKPSQLSPEVIARFDELERMLDHILNLIKQKEVQHG